VELVRAHNVLLEITARTRIQAQFIAVLGTYIFDIFYLHFNFFSCIDVVNYRSYCPNNGMMSANGCPAGSYCPGGTSIRTCGNGYLLVGFVQFIGQFPDF
jgi:hypothetical protein